jgi:hypothetical protein
MENIMLMMWTSTTCQERGAIQNSVKDAIDLQPHLCRRRFFSVAANVRLVFLNRVSVALTKYNFVSGLLRKTGYFVCFR